MSTPSTVRDFARRYRTGPPTVRDVPVEADALPPGPGPTPEDTSHVTLPVFEPVFRRVLLPVLAVYLMVFVLVSPALETQIQISTTAFTGRSEVLTLLRQMRELKEENGLDFLNRSHALLNRHAAWLRSTPNLFERPGTQADADKIPSDPKARPVQRVLILGASAMAGNLGRAIERRLEQRGAMVVRRAKVSSGLSWPDRLDWHVETRYQMRRVRPDLVLINFGGNDCVRVHTQGGALASFGTAPWDREYSRRLEDLINTAERHNARVVLIGMGTMHEPGFARRIAHLNRVVRRVARKRKALYVSIAEPTANADGSFREVLKLGGRSFAMRLQDKVHYTVRGASVVGHHIVREVQRQYPRIGKKTGKQDKK